MISMRIPRSSARLRILLITYCMAMGLCACGSASDSLPVDASVTGTYDDQSSADPASADTDTSSPDTENTSPAEPLRDATPVCLVPQADGTAVVSNDVAVIPIIPHVRWLCSVPLIPAPVLGSNYASPVLTPLFILL